MTAYNLRTLAYTGKGDIVIPVDGFTKWREPSKITLNVKRGNRSGRDTNWNFSIDTDEYADVAEGYDPAQAYRNKAEAIRSAAAIMEELTFKVEDMELIFQEGEAYREAELQAQMEEARAKKEADTPVGKKVAKQIIEHMKAEGAKLSTWSELHIKAEDRGTRRERVIKVTRSRAGLLLFSEGYNRISKNTAIGIVADSNLSTLEVSTIGFADPTLYKFLQKA